MKPGEQEQDAEPPPPPPPPPPLPGKKQPRCQVIRRVERSTYEIISQMVMTPTETFNRKVWVYVDDGDPTTRYIVQCGAPSVISWFIKPINYSYTYHKPYLLEL